MSTFRYRCTKCSGEIEKNFAWKTSIYKCKDCGSLYKIKVGYKLTVLVTLFLCLSIIFYYFYNGLNNLIGILFFAQVLSIISGISLLSFYHNLWGIYEKTGKSGT